FDPDLARAAAHDADTRRRTGATLGPLHGLPLLIKDNIDVVGFATTCNTPALATHRPARQGPVVDALLAAGAIVLGKANMHDLAFAPGMGPGLVPTVGHFGAVTHPHDAARSTGGSSSGTAAAVGAGIAPAGLGTDTGGSVRIPAAFCGIVGYRPSTGRYAQ